MTAPRPTREIPLKTVQLLIIPASSRSGSWNRKLAAFAADRVRKTGCGVSEIDLRALDLPIYDGDLEAAQGVPAGAGQLQRAIAACDAVLFVAPEYNGFPPPLLINALDWLSRAPATTALPAGLALTANKPAALLSASPGPAGGLRSMNFVRQYLQMAFAMIVVPQQFALGRAHEAFDATGALLDPGQVRAVDGVLRSVLTLASGLKGA